MHPRDSIVRVNLPAHSQPGACKMSTCMKSSILYFLLASFNPLRFGPVNLSAVLQMLSFIFLADGPCTESSWRPNEDKAQWWSRRDALVRILSASTWQSVTSSNRQVGDACFLFENQHSADFGSNDQFCRPVLIHDVEHLVSVVPVPTEKNLIQLWKDVAGGATRQRTRPVEDTWSSAVQCFVNPWKDLLLNKKGDSCGTTGANVSLSMDTMSMDKRELLKLLQVNCRVEFLRKHGLNGSESLILKKKNKDAMLVAFEDWRASNTTPALSSTNYQQPDGGSATYAKLLDTCKMLLEGIVTRAEARSKLTKGSYAQCSPASGSRGTLLLLHEDYAHELPVFMDMDHNTERSVHCSTKNKPIICAMGAVRDATDEEVAALLEAARSLNIRCVGANLGRTAEFTSKIVAALVAHSIADQLHSAVELLPTIESKKQHARCADGGNETTWSAQSSEVQKLAPQRHGAWSWDGQSNKRKRNPSSTHDGPAAKIANTAHDQFDVMCDVVHAAKSVHYMHLVAWLHITVAEVTDALDKRESMVGLVQLIVTSLWRSRLASEAALNSSNDVSSASTESVGSAAKVVPTLHLVFKDGQLATLTQSRLAIAMANQHMAAPSEYQVLQMLLACLKDPAVLIPLSTDSVQPGAGNVSADRELQDIMSRVLPAGLRKAERKAVRVVELTDTSTVCGALDTAAAVGAFGKTKLGRSATAVAAMEQSVTLTGLHNSIAQHAYRGRCSCEIADDVNTVEQAHVVLLLNRVPHPTSLEDSVGQHPMQPVYHSLYTYLYPDKVMPEDGKLEKKVASLVYCGALFCSNSTTARRTAPSMAVTILQHFAYHDRLMQAIEMAIENNTAL